MHGNWSNRRAAGRKLSQHTGARTRSLSTRRNATHTRVRLSVTHLIPAQPFAHALQPGASPPYLSWFLCGLPGSLALLWETPQPPLSHARHHPPHPRPAKSRHLYPTASPAVECPAVECPSQTHSIQQRQLVPLRWQEKASSRQTRPKGSDDSTTRREMP